MKFDLEEKVVIKENGAVGIVIDRELEDKYLLELYVVLYGLDEQSFCEEFYEYELEKYEPIYRRRK